MGLRGAGKTTIGKLIAGRFGTTFVDLDDVTPRLLGCASVAEAWDKHGEPDFRRAESQALQQALGGPARVISLGGGTPTAPGAAVVLSQSQDDGSALVVYLRAQPAALRGRLRDRVSANRPSLTGADPLDEIDAVFAKRDPAYCHLARVVIETDLLGTDAAVDEVIRVLGERGAGAP